MSSTRYYFTSKFCDRSINSKVKHNSLKCIIQNVQLASLYICQTDTMQTLYPVFLSGRAQEYNELENIITHEYCKTQIIVIMTIKIYYRVKYFQSYT